MRQWFKPKKFTKQETKLFSILMIVTICCIMTGFAAGFTYGTGSSVVSLFIHPEVVAPPTDMSITKLDNVSSVLSSQPKLTYQEGYNCIDFAWTAMRALQWRGQPSAIIRLGFPDGTGHALILVPTEDKGYQFIEPQTSQVVHTALGAVYDGKIVANMTILTFIWQPFDMFLLDPQYGMVGWDDPK